MGAKVCDDTSMKLTGFRPLDRGEVSILAALVLISILGATGLFLQSVGPGSVGQTASVGGVLAQASPEGVSTAPTSATTPTAQPKTVQQQQADANKNQSSACDKQKAAAVKNSGISPATVQKFTGGQTTENNVCVGAVFDPSLVKANDPQNTPDPKKNVANYKCVGESADVWMTSSGQGEIHSSADSASKTGMCRTRFCDSKGQNCGSTVNVSGGQSLQQWASDPNMLGSLSPQQQQSVQGLGALPSQDQLQSAFGKLDQAGRTVDQGLSACQQSGVSAANCTIQIDQPLAQSMGFQCGEGSTGSTCVTNGADALQKLDQQQAQLDQQLQQLQNKQVQLGGAAPGSGTGSGSGSDSSGSGQGSTFGSAANSLLKGLAQGFGQSMAQRPPTAPPAQSAPAQACSTDPNLYAQQQQQYQQQMQQYNYQLQQYNYQLQMSGYYNNYPVSAPPSMPSACYPSTQQQCSVQPTQPPASSCSGGGWTPQYSGNCIVGWQCSNLGASISCQPKTADVGMEIAIAYSCAQGTASGNGFDVNDPVAGTSTVTIDTPPDGTNTANYAVTCSYRGITSGAQCSVQIVKPKITLVANPQAIASGKTSQLGWITTGMNSCVIASPDDTSFTSENASNTSANGTAQTLPATTTKQYVLTCQTFSGGTKAASTTVSVQ